MSIEIQVGQEGNYCMLSAKGEVDLYTSPELREAIIKAVNGKSGVGIDLSDIAYMDSSGVATLVEGLQTSKGKDQDFVLLRPSNAVMKVLELARLDKVFDIRDSVEG